MNHRPPYPHRAPQPQNKDPYGIGAGAGILVIMVCLVAFIDWFTKQEKSVKIVIAVIILAILCCLGSAFIATYNQAACQVNCQ